MTGPTTTPYSLRNLVLYFLRLGSLGFGGPIALAGYMQRDLVEDRQWITKEEYVQGLALAQLAPGPVVITVGFIGYLVAGLGGAVAAALGVFLPCYLLVVLPAPYYRRFANNPKIKAFISGVTAAATGAIAGAAFVLGKRAIIDIPTGLIALVTLAILLKTRKVPEPIVIIAAGVAGLLLRQFHTV